MDASARQARAFRLDTDNGLLFAVYGLIGRFPAGFSVMPYYLKVQEYTNMESRDLWEYRLRLDAVVDAWQKLERLLLRITLDIPPRGAQVLRYFLFAPRVVAVAERSRELVVTVDDASRLRTVMRLERPTGARARLTHDRRSADAGRLVHVEFRKGSGPPALS